MPSPHRAAFSCGKAGCGTRSWSMPARANGSASALTTPEPILYRTRHCERSEAIQSLSKTLWIASHRSHRRDLTEKQRRSEETEGGKEVYRSCRVWWVAER